MNLYVKLANSKARIKPTAPLSVFDKENSIKFLLDLVHYIYMQGNPNPVLLSRASLWVNLLLHIRRYYKLKEKKKKRKTIFENKRKEKKMKRNNDLANLPSHDTIHEINFRQPTEQYGKQTLPFEEEVLCIKKKKVAVELDFEDYIARLQKALDSMDGKCTVCMVQMPADTNEHTHLANCCLGVNFNQ